MVVSTVWAWIGVGFFALGSLAFMGLGAGSVGRNRHHFVTSFVITLIATCSYLSIAFHQGLISGPSQAGPFGYGRFIDWALTTPLLLMGIITLSLPRLDKKPALVGGIIFSDVFMIITGIFAGLSDSGTVAKWVWYILSCGAFLTLYFLIWGPLRSAAIEQRARGEEMLDSTDPEERYEGASYKGETSLFYQQAGILSVLWFLLSYSLPRQRPGPEPRADVLHVGLLYGARRFGEGRFRIVVADRGERHRAQQQKGSRGHHHGSHPQRPGLQKIVPQDAAGTVNGWFAE